MSKIGTFREWLRESELNEAKKAQIIELKIIEKINYKEIKCQKKEI